MAKTVVYSFRIFYFVCVSLSILFPNVVFGQVVFTDWFADDCPLNSDLQFNSTDETDVCKNWAPTEDSYKYSCNGDNQVIYTSYIDRSCQTVAFTETYTIGECLNFGYGFSEMYRSCTPSNSTTSPPILTTTPIPTSTPSGRNEMTVTVWEDGGYCPANSTMQFIYTTPTDECISISENVSQIYECSGDEAIFTVYEDSPSCQGEGFSRAATIGECYTFQGIGDSYYSEMITSCTSSGTTTTTTVSPPTPTTTTPVTTSTTSATATTVTPTTTTTTTTRTTTTTPTSTPTIATTTTTTATATTTATTSTSTTPTTTSTTTRTTTAASTTIPTPTPSTSTTTTRPSTTTTTTTPTTPTTTTTTTTSTATSSTSTTSTTSTSSTTISTQSVTTTPSNTSQLVEDLPSSSDSDMTKTILIAAAIGGGVFVIVIAVLVCICLRNRKRTRKLARQQFAHMSTDSTLDIRDNETYGRSHHDGHQGVQLGSMYKYKEMD